MDLSPAGWMPVRISNDGRALVDWAYLHGVAFEDPFFDQTVERAFRNPFRLLVRRSGSLDQVEAMAGSRARDPDGLILHVSRCGSTFLASALRARAATCVLSEPGPVDTVLTTQTGAAAVAGVRALVRAMAPDDPSCAYVLKLDAWATLNLPTILAAFPEVPWVLLHRDPAEVLVSLQRHLGFHVIPGALAPHRLGLAPESLATLSLEEYAAVVLGRIMSCGYEAAATSRSVLVLDHPELGQDAGVERAAAHFGLGLTVADREAMAGVARRDAKNPALPWTDDTAEKRAAVTPELRRLADREAGAARQALLQIGGSARADA